MIIYCVSKEVLEVLESELPNRCDLYNDGDLWALNLCVMNGHEAFHSCAIMVNPSVIKVSKAAVSQIRNIIEDDTALALSSWMMSTHRRYLLTALKAIDNNLSERNVSVETIMRGVGEIIGQGELEEAISARLTINEQRKDSVNV